MYILAAKDKKNYQEKTLISWDDVNINNKIESYTPSKEN